MSPITREKCVFFPPNCTDTVTEVRWSNFHNSGIYYWVLSVLARKQKVLFYCLLPSAPYLPPSTPWFLKRAKDQLFVPSHSWMLSSSKISMQRNTHYSFISIHIWCWRKKFWEMEFSERDDTGLHPISFLRRKAAIGCAAVTLPEGSMLRAYCTWNAILKYSPVAGEKAFRNPACMRRSACFLPAFPSEVEGHVVQCRVHTLKCIIELSHRAWMGPVHVYVHAQ